MLITFTLYKGYLHKQSIISFVRNRYSEKFQKIRRKALIIVSVLSTKKNSIAGDFLWIFKVLWNTFIERLRATVFVHGLNDWWILKSITKISEKGNFNWRNVFFSEMRMLVDLRSL